MTGSEVLLDSSVWLDYFLNASEGSKAYINSAAFVLYSSVISLYEVKKKLLKDKYEGEKIEKALGFMKKRAVMVDASGAICESGASDALKFKLAIADSIIYRTAIESNAQLVTMDSDFKGLDGVVMI